MCPLATSSQHYDRDSSQGNQTRRRNTKAIQIVKEEINLSLYADSMVSCMENHEESTKTIQINKQVEQKFVGNKVNLQK